jgi:hypothetical protein
MADVSGLGWVNNDGLIVRYGTQEGRVVRGGETPAAGEYRTELVKFTLADLATTEKYVGGGIGVVLPRNARIDSVEVITETVATSGGSATLDIGLIRNDISTTYDDDGLVAALPLTSLNVAGEKTVLAAGETYAGALVGTVLANVGVITASYNTAAFTAGEVTLRVNYYMPWPAVTNS